MNLEATEVIDELLISGIISTDQHRAVVKSIWNQQEYGAEAAVKFALYQSISDVIRVAGNHGFDEEHITASLTGSLTSNLSWFARSYRRIGGMETLPAFQWVHQTKRSEARSGIDFGILARIPGGTAARAYRLVLVQAKLGEAKNLKIAIDHETNSKGRPKPELTDDASKLFAAAACSKAARAFVLSPSVTEAVNIANKGFEPGDRRYQLETILRTDLRGRALTETNRDWCFYAGWFPQHFPRAVDVRTLAAATIASGVKERPRQYSLKPPYVAFTDLFHQTIFAAESPYGLILSEELVGVVVDGVLETAPDLRLLLASADGRLDYKLGLTKELLVSGSLIPEHLIQPSAAPDFSDEFDPVAQSEGDYTPGDPADPSTTEPTI